MTGELGATFEYVFELLPQNPLPFFTYLFQTQIWKECHRTF